MITKIRFNENDREGWLKIRKELKAERKHGGSDTGKIFNANSYESDYAYFQNCLAGESAPENPDNEAMRQGRDGEQYVADRFAEVSGFTVHKENCVFTNDKHPLFFATIDRKVANMNAGLECKNHKETVISKYRGKLLPFPATHYYQILVYMMVCDLEDYYLAIRVYGVDFKVYFFTRRADAQKPSWCEAMYQITAEDFAELEERVAQFNGMLETGKWEWGFDGSDSTGKALAAEFTGKLTDTIDLTEKADLVVALQNAKAETKAAEARENAIKQELQKWMGDHKANTGTCALDGVSYKVTFKDVTTSRLNEDAIKAALGTAVPVEYYKPTTSPQMRVYEKKQK